ncbi:MAG: helix-turn-helix domain-containing protein [Aeromicrobium sp.]
MARKRRQEAQVDAVRRAKLALIESGLVRGEQPPWLPSEIDRSWRRSISAGATQTIGSFTFINEFDTDSELRRAATPVLDRLESTLQDMGTAIFLADRHGQIVARRVTGHSERERFDRAYAAEGFDFSETSIGTNGLGTPIEEGTAIFVRGAEHFNESLEQLACTGIGIRHPATGRIIGSLSLAAPVDAAENMMLAMTRQGAQQIVDNLMATVDRREVALGRSYQRHRAKGPVIVLNSDTVMTNVTGLSFLNVEMHARLWESLLAQDWKSGPHLLDLDLHALRARVMAHRLDDGEGASFAVEILDRAHEPAPRRRSRGEAVSAPVDPLVQELRTLAAGGASTVAVTGPGGAGKLHVVRAWLHTEGHDEPRIIDAGAPTGDGSWRIEATAILATGGAVVLRRLEDFDAARLNALKGLAESVPASVPGSDHRPRLVVTADLDRCAPELADALAQIAVLVAVPPLAQRLQDLPGIVESLLAEIDPARRPVISAATMQAMLRWEWPGQVAELRQLLHTLAAEHPGQAVSPYHLPERMWDAADRRPLTRIEAAERSEIVAALRQSGGNRSKAAALLGIGRTTLYRKLASLGIDDDALLH